MTVARPKTVFGLALIPPVLVGIGAVVWLAKLPDYRAQDISVGVCLWGFAGVFAGLQWLLFVERRLRGDEIGWVGSWTLKLGGPLALAFCVCAVGLDLRKGDRFSIVSIPAFAMPYFLVVAPGMHVLARRLRHAWKDSVLSFLSSAALFTMEYRFFSNRSEDIWILVSILVLPLPVLILFLGGVGAIRRQRNVLRDKGFAWVTWRDAFFATLNNLEAGRVPPHQEVATLPGFEDGDIRTLCRLTRQA